MYASQRSHKHTRMKRNSVAKSGKVLITELDETEYDDDNKSVTSIKSGYNTYGNQPQYVSKVEEESFTFSRKDNKLPPQVSLDGMLSKIVDSMKFDNYSIRNSFDEQIQKQESKHIMQDTFWFFFNKHFYNNNNNNNNTVNNAGTNSNQDESDNDLPRNVNSLKSVNSDMNQSLLFDKISRNYVSLFTGIPKDVKDLVLSKYWDILAQVVFSSFCSAYPKSKSKFNKKFKLAVIDTCAEWISGIRPSNVRCAHWTCDSEMHTINKARVSEKTKPRKTTTSLSNLLSDNKESAIGVTSSSNGGGIDRKDSVNQLTMPSLNAFKKKKKTTSSSYMSRDLVRSHHHLSHSPLVRHFLVKNHIIDGQVNDKNQIVQGGEGKHPFKVLITTTANRQLRTYKTKDMEYKLKKSRKKIPKLLDDDALPVCYNEVAVDAERKRKQMIQSHRKLIEKNKEDVKLSRKKMYLKLKRMEQQRAETIDVHEYSNWLVSNAAQS